jgi:hypothetical protein
MRMLVIAVVIAAGGLLAAAAPAATRTALTVTFWEDGARTDTRVTWTLRCDPPSGTLRRPAVACARLRTGGTALFRPIPKDAACTELYGGPQVALVRGTVAGVRVWARLQRRNGCEIERWARFSPWLIPRGGVTPP